CIVPVYATYIAYVNLDRPPLTDARVRAALSLAIDRAALATQVLRDGSKPAASLLPPDAHGYTFRGEPRLQFDPAEAQRLLAAAGFPGGRGCPPIELATNTLDTPRLIAEALQQMWRHHLGL